MEHEKIKRILKKLKEERGAVKTCLLVGLDDTRTLSVWINRGVPRYRFEHVKNILKKEKIK